MPLRPRHRRPTAQEYPAETPGRLLLEVFAFSAVDLKQSERCESQLKPFVLLSVNFLNKSDGGCRLSTYVLSFVRASTSARGGTYAETFLGSDAKASIGCRRASSF